MVSGWQNVQVPQQQKFSDGPLTSNLENQRVIPWASGDLGAKGMYEIYQCENRIILPTPATSLLNL